jgi:hypothetical protein
VRHVELPRDSFGHKQSRRRDAIAMASDHYIGLST